MRLLSLVLILFTNLFCASAQKVENPEKVIEQVMEALSERDIDLNNQSQIFDDLLELYDNPISLNKANIEDIEKLIFLSDIQINNLVEYIERLGPLFSKFQLQGVDGLKREDIERLMIFVRIQPLEEPYRYKKRLDGQFILRDQFDAERARGYSNDTALSGYLGDRHHLYSKLQVKYGDKLSGGLVVDKDPGEELLPVDFISGYVMYNSDKLVKTLIIGDFHASFAQGLALWTGTSMGKTSEPLSIRKRGEGFKRYSSANEYAFLRGIGTTLNYKQIELSVFASHKNRDADIEYNLDSTFLTVASMPETGYHRAQNELDKRNQLQQSTYGANINYRFKNLSLSLGGFYQQYNADSIVVKELYQYVAHESNGTKQLWLGYNFGLNKLITFGEFALADNGAPAILNGLQFKPANNVSVALLYRYYAKNYYSPWQNGFSENSFPAGESGFYVGMNIFPFPKLKLAGYVDLFTTDWLKYSIDKPSKGHDISFQADYNLNHRFKVYLRYIEKEKYKNQTIENEPAYPIAATNAKKVRLHTDMKASQNWTVEMRIEKSFYKEESQDNSEGMLAYGGMKYSTSNSKIACWLRYSVFDTENYQTRLYTYENDLLYNFSTPAFQGEGSRVYLMLRYQIVKNIKLWLKAGRTMYNDREQISSGLQTVDGGVKTNVRMQLQVKF